MKIVNITIYYKIDIILISLKPLKEILPHKVLTRELSFLYFFEKKYKNCGPTLFFMYLLFFIFIQLNNTFYFIFHWVHLFFLFFFAISPLQQRYSEVDL